jgi:imidazolonepropionase-like amidohydrolase
MRAKSFQLAVIAALAATVFSDQVRAQPDCLVLRAGRILPVCPDLPEQIDDGVIVVRDGRITAIGGRHEIAVPPDAVVVDVPDATITPGLVAAASDLGGAHQGDESIAAGYRAVDAFDCFGNFKQLLAAGVTTVHINPGPHRLLTGQGAVVRLGGPASDRILRAQADLTVNLDPAVWNPPPDVTYSFPASADVEIPLPRRQRPASRMDQLLALDEAIRDALAGKNFKQYSTHPPALAEAWQAKLPLRIRADRAADLLSGIRFLRQNDRSGYVVGGTEADRVAGELRGSGVPLVYVARTAYQSAAGDLGTDPAALEPGGGDFAALEGIQLALSTPSPADLRLAAARAARAGLEPRRALAAVTRSAAEILGVADRIGSLGVGRDADLLVLTGHPLSVSTHVHSVYVEGRQVFQAPVEDALVVKAGTVWIGPGNWIENGQILVEGGKIRSVGRTVPHPRFARVIDLPHAFVAPGFIDAHGHLGLRGDRTAGASELRFSKLVGAADVTDARVAAAGITTVLVSPYAASNSKGAACAAIKTAGTHREQRVVRDPVALLFDVSTADPLSIAATLDQAISAGQKYVEAWTKYEKDLKEFLEKKEKGEQPAGTGEPKVEERKESVGPDPLTGTWDVTLTGGPMPAPIKATVVMQLTGTTVQGRVTGALFRTGGRLTGTFDGKHISAEIAPEGDFPGVVPRLKLEADIVKEDELEGTIAAGGLSLTVTGKRVDKQAVNISVSVERRRSKDGRPVPPTVDPSLEPLKALLEKKISAVVNVSTPAQIREVLAVLCDKHKVPVTLLNAQGASAHAAQLAEKKVTVIVPPVMIGRRMNRDYLQADDLNRLGVPITFQSNAEDGARDLPAAVLFAVERGMSAEAALEGMTIGAARAFKIDDRVGTIEPGKDADLVIFSGHPFLEAGSILRVIVDGKEVRP